MTWRLVSTVLAVHQMARPLFGVQFSQLAYSDFTLAATGNGPGVGSQRSHLGLSADPGGTRNGKPWFVEN